MSNARLGLIVGMALGFARAFGGPEAAAIVAAGGAIGLIAGRSLDGVGDLVAATDTMIQRARAGMTSTRESSARFRTQARSKAEELNERRRVAWQAQQPAWKARRAQTAWNRRTSASEETRVLRLDDLTKETVEIRGRR